jgi:hypothetical protein
MVSGWMKRPGAPCRVPWALRKASYYLHIDLIISDKLHNASILPPIQSEKNPVIIQTHIWPEKSLEAVS